MDILIIVAGVLLLCALGNHVERKLRKPPLRQLVAEFLYFDYSYQFVDGAMRKIFFLAENRSKYPVTLAGFPDGIGVRYLGELEGVRVPEELLMNLLVAERVS